MADGKILEEFQANRRHLRAVALRMLGSAAEADDAVQEAWLRLDRAGGADIANLRGWLTTVVARICLDMLRARKSRREETLDKPEHEAIPGSDAPDTETEIADSIGLAMLVVLEALNPAERVAFVLHDMFDLPFEEIAPIVGRSPDAARQLASRARKRVQGTEAPDANRDRRRTIVEAFLAAARGGDFAALLAVLDPDVVLRADAAAVATSRARQAAGAPAPELEPEMHGAALIAKTFAGRAAAAVPALIDGELGMAWAVNGRPRALFVLTVENGRIREIDLVADAEEIAGREVEILGG
jgi:RNA polymerase sigma-70 factor (ECF subfamily)